MIEDDDATKPADWDDDAPLVIPDPAAKKPDDWDDEEDGDFEAPEVSNPKCKSGHCGEWKRPQKKNPAYKGKWSAPKIDNPAYKGEWSPKQIDNPNFFEDKEPHKMAPIAAVAIEVWTMSKGMQFDNFYVGRDEAGAKAYGEATWAKKAAVEDSNDADAKKEKAQKEREAKRAAGGVMNLAEVYVLDFLDVVMENVAISIIAAVVIIVALVFMCGSGGGSDDETDDSAPAPADNTAAKKKNDDVKEAEADDEDDDEEEEEEEEDKPKLRKRGKKTPKAD